MSLQTIIEFFYAILYVLLVYEHFFIGISTIFESDIEYCINPGT